jgi:hypothetical protein
MTMPEKIDPIDELLRQHDAHVEDHGFTARVINALPRQRRTWVSPAILLSATAVGSMLAVFWVPWRNLPAFDPSDVLHPSTHTLLPWIFALAVAGSLIWSALAALLRFEY